LIENKKIRRKRRTSSERLKELIDTMLNSPMPILTPADRIKIVVVDLRAVIDRLDRNFTSAKSLILKLARLLDETKECKQSQICAKIKEILQDKIKEGKITKKWIERCLPQGYRRSYVKSEQSSLSGKAKKLEKIIIVDNKGNTVAGEERSSWTRSQQSEEATPPNAPLIKEYEYLSAAEIKFTIPKDRYEEVETAMRNGSRCCYLIFDRNTGLLLRSESSEIDN
jgi:uncharacterized protein YnzC (UPF0291/DUF896 family)